MSIFKISLDEFHEIVEKMEATYNYHFEYVRGEVFPVQGGKALPAEYLKQILSKNFPDKLTTIDTEMATTRHDRITSNLQAFLAWHTRDSDIVVYSQGTYVYIEIKKTVRVPDVTAVKASTEKRNKKHYLLNPLALFETWSKSTQKIDETEKSEEYKSIESVMEYVMISQDKPYVSVNRRMQGSSWAQEIYTSLADVIYLESLNVSIPLSEIYRNINWEEKE